MGVEARPPAQRSGGFQADVGVLVADRVQQQGRDLGGGGVGERPQRLAALARVPRPVAGDADDQREEVRVRDGPAFSTSPAALRASTSPGGAALRIARIGSASCGSASFLSTDRAPA
ncbi:hypothetical protein [Actinomadura nitritigenes]|uniref:hypothetical protein n=1 Tax=Actinomadura nitritigenes TaxID=134602 RepID=UPI003D8BACB4